jgi:ankyrin repeat protein
LVKSLLDAKATISQENSAKETALHLAAQGGSVEVVETLLKA